MRRPVTLRQIESFKAVVEHGTVSRAALLLNISQPAVSRLIANLELDTGLQLFDRLKGRLAPTDHAMRLYEEIGRIFSGVRQVDNAVDAILREEKGRIAVGVLPALSGQFIQRATTSFLAKRGNVFCEIETTISSWIADRLIARQLDLGLVSGNVDNPYVIREPLLRHPLICIMPLGHPLAEKKVIEPDDLGGLPFVAFPDTDIGHLVEAMFDTHRVHCNKVIISNVAPALCELVAAGIGVSLVHPLVVSGLEHRLVARPFVPELPYHFYLCRSADSRNSELVDAYADEVLTTANLVSQSLR